MTQSRFTRAQWLAFGAATTFAVAASVGCTTKNFYQEYVTVSDDDDEPPDAGGVAEPEPTAEPEVLPDAGPDPDAGPQSIFEGAPLPDRTPETLAVDLFGTVGNHFWFAVSDEQLERMNGRYGGGGPIFFNQFGDIYSPGGEGEVTFADHVLLTVPGRVPRTADFGKIEVKLVGESTGRPWTADSLPNLKLDTDEFQEGLRIGGNKHFRLNNAVVGSIYREKLTLDLYRTLGYPAPQATYAWVSSNVWGAEVAVPYVLVESYKPQFCKRREEEMGGECINMWEFPGDFGNGSFNHFDSCQFHECDPSRVNLLEEAVMQTPPGAGFKEALAEWIDWDAFHRFQCLSWILATGDDALHNSNNLVLAERADGKFQLLPYSVDISLGQDWYPEVPLAGTNTLATGCQNDPECWAATIDTCEGLLADFTAADPVGMLNDVHQTLEKEGMLRSGDEQRYEALKAYLKRRLKELPDELELNRDAPQVPSYCDPPLMDCGGYCMYPEECWMCEPGPLEPLFAEDRAIDGIAVAPGDPLPPPGEPVPPPPDPVVDGGVIDPDPNEPPVGCLPYINLY